jgi:hypothetical protein
MLPTNNSSIILLLLIPTVRAIAVHGYATIEGGQAFTSP